jgi:hypothetical protein
MVCAVICMSCQPTGVPRSPGIPSSESPDADADGVDPAAMDESDPRVDGQGGSDGSSEDDGGSDPPADPDDLPLIIIDDESNGDGGGLNRSPLADAGRDIFADEGARVELDGTGSADPDGDELSYTWRQIAGPDVVLDGHDRAVAAFEAPEVDGDSLLVFRLTVSDGEWENSDEVDVRVADLLIGASVDVTADAGADQEVLAGDFVELDGRGSFGTGEDPLEFLWTQREGLPVVLSADDRPVVTFTAPSEFEGVEALAFELIVSRGDGVDSDRVEVLVMPSPETPSPPGGGGGGGGSDDERPECSADNECADELFCNGDESCEDGQCAAGVAPCPEGLCDESSDDCLDCRFDSDCQNGIYCDGDEVCTDGRCAAGDDPCPGRICEELSQDCADCRSGADCDDGVFCNGREVCSNGECVSGDEPCPGQFCRESQDACADCLTNADCDDGLFCNGTERCSNGECLAGGNPCPGQFCEESADVCVDCRSNADCDDGLFCNGEERCADGGCVAGDEPCPGQYCEESEDACVDCRSNADCDDGLFCNGDERCTGGACVAGDDPCDGMTCDEEAETCSGLSCDAQNPLFGSGVQAGTLLGSDVDEASGIVASRSNPDVLWTHNDDGGDNRLFAINVDGTLLGAYTVGSGAYDPEDIAIGPGPQGGVDYLYWGDIGDNDSVRSSIFVKRVAEPFVDANQDPVNVVLGGVDVLRLQYPTGGDAPSHKDSETLLIDPLNGDLYLVTKRTSRNRVYRAAYPQSTTETTTMTFVAEADWGGSTGGDVSPDGTLIVIRQYTGRAPEASVWQRPAGGNFWDAFAGDRCDVDLRSEPQGESICFDRDGRGLYTVSENESPGAQIPIWYYPRNGG